MKSKEFYAVNILRKMKGERTKNFPKDTMLELYLWGEPVMHTLEYVELGEDNKTIIIQTIANGETQRDNLRDFDVDEIANICEKLQ